MELKCKHKDRKCRACLRDNTSLFLCDICYKELSIQIQADLTKRIFAYEVNPEQ